MKEVQNTFDHDLALYLLMLLYSVRFNFSLSIIIDKCYSVAAVAIASWTGRVVTYFCKWKITKIESCSIPIEPHTFVTDGYLLRTSKKWQCSLSCLLRNWNLRWTEISVVHPKVWCIRRLTRVLISKYFWLVHWLLFELLDYEFLKTFRVCILYWFINF